MKKILLNTFALAILSSGYSQISITKALFDQYQDTTVTFGVTNASEINIGSNSTNGQWDVSNATIVTPTVGVFKAYNSALPGASNFPNATHYSSVHEINEDGSLSATDSYGFAIINNSEESLLGTYGEEEINNVSTVALMKYEPAQKLLTFPFNYQSNVAYNTVRTMSFEESEMDDVEAAITGTYTYEGWGKVKYPGDVNYTDCARMRRVETNTTVMESIEEGMGSRSTIKVEMDQTDFISTEFKTFSLLTMKVTSTTVLIMGGVETPLSNITQSNTTASFSKGTGKAEIQQIALGQSDEKYFTGVNLYPNPTVEKVAFNSVIPVSKVEVISANGSSYTEENIDNSLEIKGEKGLYLVKLTLSNGASKSFKVVKN